VGADRHQAKEGIQIETAQGADVGAHPEIALGQEGLCNEGDTNGQLQAVGGGLAPLRFGL